MCLYLCLFISFLKSCLNFILFKGTTRVNVQVVQFSRKTCVPSSILFFLKKRMTMMQVQIFDWPLVGPLRRCYFEPLLLENTSKTMERAWSGFNLNLWSRIGRLKVVTGTRLCCLSVDVIVESWDFNIEIR